MVHLIKNYIIIPQCVLMNAFLHACPMQALLERNLSFNKTQH